MVFQLPKQTVIFGPRQIAARINQDQVIAPQITLWNQQGSEVIQGTLLVIPIEESLLYIRPLYLRAAGGRIPELKRVVVAYQNRIVMEETLDAALARLFPDPVQRSAACKRGVPTLRRPSALRQRRSSSDRRAGRSGASALPARDAGAARRQLGAVRRGDQAPGRGAGAHQRAAAVARRHCAYQDVGQKIRGFCRRRRV